MAKAKPKSTKTSMLSDKLQQSADQLYGTSDDLPRVIEIDLDKLSANPDQPRTAFDEDALGELASSIEQHGLIQPITVIRDPEHEDRYLIVAGERRFRAFQRLERTTIPAIMTSGNPDEIALIENIQRQDLSPVEEAEALRRMMERHGYTQGELGKVVGKKQNTISEILKLTSLPQQIKDEYRASDTAVSKSVLVELTRIKDKTEQLRVWKSVKGGMTLREVRKNKPSTSRHARKQTPLSPTQALFSAGQRFVAQLEKLEAETTLDDEAYSELLDLYDAIGNHITRLSRPEQNATGE